MKERNDGTGKFYSLSVKRKENQPKQSNPSHDGARARKLDNDAPF
jgi:hypothetical protein